MKVEILEGKKIVCFSLLFFNLLETFFRGKKVPEKVLLFMKNERKFLKREI